MIAVNVVTGIQATLPTRIKMIAGFALETMVIKIATEIASVQLILMDVETVWQEILPNYLVL